MPEKPILFSGPMVRAILRDEKTNTRRVITPQPEQSPVDWTMGKNGVWYLHDKHGSPTDGFIAEFKCPYGKAGDILWVRETWQQYQEGPNGQRATVDVPMQSCGTLVYASNCDEEPPKWRPSIFMPRWASRITLEVTEVSVERLCDISEEDAIAEGVGEFQIGRPFRKLEAGNGIQAAALALGLASSAKPFSRRAFLSGGSAAFAGIAAWLSGGGKFPNEMEFRHTFALLWDQINANRNVCKRCKGFGVVTAWEGSVSAGSLEQTADDCPDCGGVDRSYCWENNPWVWVVKFKRLEESK